MSILPPNKPQVPKDTPRNYGILIKINPIMEAIIRELLDLWCQQLHLTVSVHSFHKVFQKDVNNYVYLFVKLSETTALHLHNSKRLPRVFGKIGRAHV